LPLESNNRSAGLDRLLEDVPAKPVVKLDWPITTDADSPLEKGAVNSTTLLLPKSDTQRFPFESKAASNGPDKLLADAATAFVNEYTISGTELNKRKAAPTAMTRADFGTTGFERDFALFS